MLCERCGKHEANVHITKNINGKVTEMNLCSECANRSGEMISFDGMFRDFFSSIMPARARRFDYRQPYLLNEYAGCEDCLEDREAQPADAQEKKEETKEDKIAELRQQIQLAVMNEEYEKAAELRDKIKALESGEEAQ